MRRSELSLPHWYKCSGIRVRCIYAMIDKAFFRLFSRDEKEIGVKVCPETVTIKGIDHTAQNLVIPAKGAPRFARDIQTKCVSCKDCIRLSVCNIIHSLLDEIS